MQTKLQSSRLKNVINFLFTWESALKNSDITKDIYDQMVVNNIYCVLPDDTSYTTYLLISTNMGNYIYFHEHYGSNSSYFMTVEQYSNVAKKIREKHEEICSQSDDIPYCENDIAPTSVADLSAYKVVLNESSDTDNNKNGCSSSLTSVAIIIPAITAAYVIKKKKED